MTTTTQSQLLQHLEQFRRVKLVKNPDDVDGPEISVNRWVLEVEGVMNQSCRAKALEQALQNLSNMPSEKIEWLFTHLKEQIAIDLANKPSYETNIKLQLTAYAIIKHLQIALPEIATRRIIAMKCPEFSRLCEGGKIE